MFQAKSSFRVDVPCFSQYFPINGSIFALTFALRKPRDTPDAPWPPDVRGPVLETKKTAAHLAASYSALEAGPQKMEQHR